jgi:hypothetical protein
VYVEARSDVTVTGTCTVDAGNCIVEAGRTEKETCVIVAVAVRVIKRVNT